MRLVSLVVFITIVGGAVYLVAFKRDWLFEKAEEGLRLAQGYTPAKTPRQAMEQFLKAVKERNYKAAAIYCTSEYAETLKKAHAPAADLGSLIDKAQTAMEDKWGRIEKATYVLRQLDPWPTCIKIGDVKEQNGKELAYGIFMPDLASPLQAPTPMEVQRLDPRMFANCLAMPVVGVKLAIKPEGAGDDKHWVIHVPMVQLQHDAVQYFLDHYKSYVHGMNEFRDRINRDTMLKDQVATDLINVLAASK
jgi:hypothetical protein